MTQIWIPNLCADCIESVVSGARLREVDPWKACIVVVQIALFQTAAAHPRVRARCAPTSGDGEERDSRDLGVVLAEIGCLGCFLPRSLAITIADVRKHGMHWVADQTKDAEKMQRRVEALIACEQL